MVCQPIWQPCVATCSSGMLEPGSSEANRTRQGRDQANRYDVGLVIACILSWLFVQACPGKGCMLWQGRTFRELRFRTHISGHTSQGAHRGANNTGFARHAWQDTFETCICEYICRHIHFKPCIFARSFCTFKEVHCSSYMAEHTFSERSCRVCTSENFWQSTHVRTHTCMRNL